MARRFNLAHRIDDAVDVEGLKTRLRTVLQVIESNLEASVNQYFIDSTTDVNPKQFKRGDFLIDTTLIPGFIALYAFDGANKLAISLRSLAGDLPLSRNEIFTGDGSTKNFNTLFPFVVGSTQVYKQGSRQLIGTDYTENITTQKQVQFVTAPASGNKVIVDYTIIQLT